MGMIAENAKVIIIIEDLLFTGHCVHFITIKPLEYRREMINSSFGVRKTSQSRFYLNSLKKNT